MPPAAVGPRSVVPVTWLDPGSTRQRRLAVPCLALALVTQTAPSPTATWWGRWSVVLGSRTRAATSPVAGSTRTSVPSRRLATHSARSPAASAPSQQRGTGTTVSRLPAGSIRPRPPRSGRATQRNRPATVRPPGVRPTGTVATTRPDAGSIRVTVPSLELMTQTAPAPTARPEGSRPSGMVATSSLVAGSIRDTLLSSGDSTQAASSVTARRAGTGGTAIDIRSPVAGSMRNTQAGFALPTQRAPAPVVTAIGREISGRVSTTRAGAGGAAGGGPATGSVDRSVRTPKTAPPRTAATTRTARTAVVVRCRRRRRPRASSRSITSTLATLRSSAPAARRRRSSITVVLPVVLPSGGEADGQGLAAPVELGLDRPLGQPEGPGDLGHRGVGHIAQGDHLRLAPGQGPDGPPHLGVLLGQLGYGRAFTVQQPAQRPGLQQPPLHGPAGPADRDLADPGRRLADVVPVPEGPQERVLGDVLGGQSAPGQGVGQPHDRLVLADVERLEPLRLGQRAEMSGRINRVDPRLHRPHPFSGIHRPYPVRAARGVRGLLQCASRLRRSR